MVTSCWLGLKLLRPPFFSNNILEELLEFLLRTLGLCPANRPVASPLAISVYVAAEYGFAGAVANAGFRPGGWRRRSQSGSAGSFTSHISRRSQRAHAPDGRPCDLRAWSVVRVAHFHAAQKSASASQHARDFRVDLRDLQDLSDHAGQVPAHPLGVYRGYYCLVLRLAGARSRETSLHHTAGHPAFQLDWNRRELWRGLVRHPREYVRQLADRIRQPGG